MKYLGQLCQCRYCRGNSNAVYNCGCKVGREKPSHWGERGKNKHIVKTIIVNGTSYPIEKIVSTGGRNADYLFLEDGEEVIWHTARQVGDPIEDPNLEEVVRYDASVHSCWKVRCNQEIVIAKRKDIINSKKEVVSMVYIANSFSLNMLAIVPADLSVKEITVEDVKKLLNENQFLSVIGHEATANILTEILQTSIKANRVPLKIGRNDKLIIFQILKRLEEGKILSPEEIKDLPTKFFLVEMK